MFEICNGVKKDCATSMYMLNRNVTPYFFAQQTISPISVKLAKLKSASVTTADNLRPIIM